MRGATAERQKACKHLDDGGLAAAVGTKKAEDFALFDAEAHVVHGGEFAEPPDQMFGRHGSFGGVFWRSCPGLVSRFQFHVGGHTCENVASGIVDADLDAEDLMNALLASLHISRKKLGL